ncbi:hypothetical protein LPMP_300300 [Leishmania panamensis]|uniref:Uncharacterized protein n=1 Tax=Leishmania panamensis TaxID=5679 RepID=A0A088RYA0_LEIPA|nr:hypothetical protein LPMP_300300 [Leishmania panamensis]AIO00265.1 hypothetical protein LPMP_300300 [Leishmania panamensis]
MPCRRVCHVCACVALLLVAGWGGSGGAVNSTTQPVLPNAERVAVALADESISAATAFTNLMQLSEAVLAPVWSAGGFSYVLKSTGGTSAPVCAHTRASGGGITAPFTFSMFDTQFSPVYLVSLSAVESTGEAASLTAEVAGRLDLRRGCYTTPTSLGTCAGVLQSSPPQCMLGELDALHTNWTADSLAAATSAMRADESLTLSSRGLSAAEVLTVFMSDYLPQRAWLRTAVPRVVDALAHAEQAARAYRTIPLTLWDAAEAAEMQRAVAGQWGGYLWSTYVPQLQRKWALLYRLAVATLTPLQMAPSLDDTATGFITGVPGPAPKTSCLMVDAWVQLQHSVASSSSSSGLRTFARLVTYMEDALDRLGEVLSNGGGAGALSEEQADTLVSQLLQRTYCVTTTYLFSLTALFDAPFLHASSSVWVEPATHMHAWAMRTMQEASVADALANATVFQEATAARVARVSASLPRNEKALLACLAMFLDATRPLTSAATTSPSDCVQALLKARADASGVPSSAALGVLWDVSEMRTVKPTSAAVPGITRYESSVPLATAFPAAKASLQHEFIHWTMFQQASTSFTGQRSLYTPSIVASAPMNPCAAGHAADAALHTGLNRAASSEDRHRVLVGAQVAETCPAGTYAKPDAASCEVCPSLCSASPTPPTPVYCPGDGLMHGCPVLPAGALSTGSPNAGLDNAKAACRYACIDVYQAPLHKGCVSMPGLFYNTTAILSDGHSGGWYDACVGPASLLPRGFPAQSHDARVFVFVGSGATDEPMSCRFVLMHRVVSSAVSAETLWAVGLLPPPLSVSAPSATATSSAGLLPHRGGVAWEAAMQLNATLLWEMHRSLLRSQQQASGTGTGAVTTSIGHVLVALREGGEGVASQSRWSWSLVSSYQHPAGVEAATITSATDTAPPPSVSFTLRLLLNASILAIPQSTDATTTWRGCTEVFSMTPAPSSLTVLSSPWTWSVKSVGVDYLAKATYRVVLSRSTSTVAFFADAAAVGSPVTVDWPLWKHSQMTSPPSAKTTMYLSVAGWVARYVEREQWMVMSPSFSFSSSPQPSTLPLHYDYVPGMMTRLSSTAFPVSPLHEALSRAEASWHSQAQTTAQQQSRDVAALTDVHLLSLYVASFPAVTASVSAVLNGLSVRQSRGLDGVCRSSYGSTPTVSGTSVTPACAMCTSGSYTVLNATPDRSKCACLPQRTSVYMTPSAGQQVRACLRRPDGPAAPSSYMRPPGLLFIDSDVAVADGVFLGWYGSGTGATGTGLPAATSLEGSVICTYGLTVPRLTTTAPSTSLNLSVTLQYTTGLGAEECHVMAAARGDSPAYTTQPSYSAISSYGLRLRAPRLPVRAIALVINSRLFTDQTVLTVSVRDYALLPRHAVDSLMHMRGITEYHVAFLIYILRCATVSAVLRCGSTLRVARNFTWAGSSSLDSLVLRVNLTGMITEACQVSFTVLSATAAASEASVPHTSWPYTYLATEANASLFFEASPTVHYTLHPSVETFAATKLRYDPLAEDSSLVISSILLALSLSLVSIILVSVGPPSLHPLSWRAYERARARRHCQHRQLHNASLLERGAD